MNAQFDRNALYTRAKNLQKKLKKSNPELADYFRCFKKEICGTSSSQSAYTVRDLIIMNIGFFEEWRPCFCFFRHAPFAHLKTDLQRNPDSIISDETIETVIHHSGENEEFRLSLTAFVMLIGEEESRVIPETELSNKLRLVIRNLSLHPHLMTDDLDDHSTVSGAASEALDERAHLLF